MYYHHLRLFILAIALLSISCRNIEIQSGEKWEGMLELPKGAQKAQAEIDFDLHEGMLVLPDLIPVPLELTEISRRADSVFFTIGFRSGPAPCKAIIRNDTIKGVMLSSRTGDIPFWLAKTGAAESIFNQPKPSPDTPITIETHEGIESEKAVKKRLEALLEKHDLEKYLYTKAVKIQSGTIPHSHPVLTLNTNFDNDIYLLSTFLHEQMHWYSLSKQYDNEVLGTTIFEMYPEVPTTLPEGAGSAQSTYLHILICYLEFHTLAQVIGKEEAKKHMEFMIDKHYTWVYQTILADEERLHDLFDKHGLLFD
ncbi:MAG: hypothetical protein HEP71_04605 [Roseivirga sp.]|nr:hypothetical protein [Roseivirga sp.]